MYLKQKNFGFILYILCKMIIVSFTTTPERLEKQLPLYCIESILKQSIIPNYIVLNIPRVSKNGKIYSYESVKKLEKHFEKYLDTIKIQFGTDEVEVLIILVDDDCVYENHLIENLTDVKRKNPNELAIGTAARIKYKNKLEFIEPVNSDNNYDNDHIYVDILETFAGVLYDYKLFENTTATTTVFTDWINDFPEFVMFADDIIISKWVKKQGHKLYKIVQSKSNLIIHDSKQTTELNTSNELCGNNEKVYEYLEQKEHNERINKLIMESKKIKCF